MTAVEVPILCNHIEAEKYGADNWLHRPVEIKEDIDLVEQRSRVSLLLQSPAFRSELEEVIGTYNQANNSCGINSSLLSLQHLSELVSSVPGRRPLTGGCLLKGNQGGIIPINDLRIGDASFYPTRERIYRCKLASVCRLIYLFGWNTNISNHATFRLSHNDEQFLVNPVGLLYQEITASSLIKVDSKGEIFDPGSTVLGLDQSGWLLHSAVYSARPNIRCIIHVATSATIAISCMKNGLLPLSHEAIVIGDVSYYNASSSDNNNFESSGDINDLLVSDGSHTCAAIKSILGPNVNVLFVRRCGLLALGETVEEAWHFATNAVLACETQLRLSSLGVDHLVFPDENVRQQAYDTWRTTELAGIGETENALAFRAENPLSLSPTGPDTKDGYLSDSSIRPTASRSWHLGELEFEALMRHLDNEGYRTGHVYRKDWLSSPQSSRRTLERSGAARSHTARTHDEVEIPPYTSSVTASISHNYEDGIFSGDESEVPRPGSLRRQGFDKLWVNSPNSYTKDQDSSVPGLQYSARWISSREATLKSEDGSRLPIPFSPLTPAAYPYGWIGGQKSKISGPKSCCRFAPQGSNPNELKDQQKKVKDKYYHDTNTSGPQSRLLDGVTWEEARRIRDDALAKHFGLGNTEVSSEKPTQPPLAVASKAIIQKDVVHKALVYDGVYSTRNPFEMTDDDLAAYRAEIETKNNPVMYTEWLENQNNQTSCNKQVDLVATTTDAVSQLSPSLVKSLTMSDASEVDGPYLNGVEMKRKKKHVFKLPSFSRKAKTIHKKDVIE